MIKHPQYYEEILQTISSYTLDFPRVGAILYCLQLIILFINVKSLDIFMSDEFPDLKDIVRSLELWFV